MLMPFLCWKMLFNYISLIVWHLDKCKLIYENTTYSLAWKSSFRGKWRRCNILLSISMPLFAFRLMPTFAMSSQLNSEHIFSLCVAGCDFPSDAPFITILHANTTKCQTFFGQRPFCSQAYRFSALWVLFSIASLFSPASNYTAIKVFISH